MILDKLGRIFENRRKKDIPVEVDRRKKENKEKGSTKASEKTKK